jgi:hypothetical protein
MADTIQSLLAELAKQSNSFAPPTMKSKPIKYKSSKYKKINLAPYNFSSKDFGSLASPSSSTGANILNALGTVLNDTIGQTSGFMTNTAYNAIKHIQSKDESTASKIMHLLPPMLMGETLAQGIKGGAKNQWKDWTDGKLSWGDIPSFGFLHGMRQSEKNGEDIMKDEVGVKNRWGAIGGGIALDILLDPLTYLTGGASAAGKLSKAAELAKMAELSKGMGLTGKFKNANQFLATAKASMKAGMVAKYTDAGTGALKVSENIIDSHVEQAMSKIADEIKTARNTTYNNHINDWGLAVPFTNKFGKIGTYGEKNLLHSSEAKVGDTLVKNLIKDVAKDNPTHITQLTNFAKARYGVDDLNHISKTQFDDLSEVLDKFRTSKVRGLPDSVGTATKEADLTAHQAYDFNDALDILNKKTRKTKKTLEDIKTPTIKDPTKAIDKFKQTYKTEWEHFLHGNPDKIDPLKAKEFYKNLAEIVDSPYNKMGNFKTKFEHALDTVNPFDARTLKTGDKFLNSMGDHIADANSQRVGETARYTKGMDDIEKFIKKQKLGEAEQKTLMQHAIYILENHAPDELGGAKWVPSRAAQQLANKIRPVIDRLGSEESKAGTLDKLRKNYFPHVINKDEDTLKAIDEFNKRHPDLSSLNGKSAKSGFNKERKSFQTLAQRDNYIKKLEKAIQSETNPDTIESLQAQQERIAKMYDTDVVSALQRRIKEGVRAKAMKDMQGKLSKYGMMKTIETGSKDAPPSGLEKIDPAEAKKLGLGEGTHYIHPEVLKGLKRVDEIFTAEGMKKWQRHLTAFADAWRPLVTFYKLSHYRNNIIGNVINNLAAGVKASDYKVARKLIMGYRSGKLTDAEMKVMESAFKHNVVSGGFLYDGNQTFSHADPNALEKLGKFLSQNKAIKEVRHHLGETPDDISRMANYINGLNKFGSTEHAAKQVRTYLFNYNELTNADRGMRVMVPFWNWTKRNIPLQAKLLMENPKFAMNIERFKDLFNEDEKGQDWQKEGGIKVPKANYYTTMPSPTNDLGQLLHPLQFAGSLNPLPKSIIELMTNHKLFTGAPISYGSNSVQAKDIPAYTASNLGILGDLYKLLDGERTPTESLINSANPITRIK